MVRLAPQDIERLIAAASGRDPSHARNRALVATLAGTALGVGEALALRSRDLEERDGHARAPGARARLVPLDDPAAAEIALWRGHREALGMNGHAPVFCTMAGAGLEPSYVRRLLTRLGRRAGIDGAVNARALREAFVARRLAEGATSRELQAELGHLDPASTRRLVRQAADRPARPAADDSGADLIEPLLRIAHCGLMVLRARRDATGTIVEFDFERANPAAAGLLKTTPDALRGRAVSDVFPDSPSDGTYARWRELIDMQGRNGEPERRQDMEGASRWFTVRRDAIGDRILLSFDDVSALKRLKRDHAERLARCRAISTAAREGAVVLGPDGRVLEANPAAERILGVPRDLMIAGTSRDPRWRAVRPDGTPIPADQTPSAITIATGRAVAGEVVGLHRPDGVIIWISISTEALVENGGPPFSVAVLITEVDDPRGGSRSRSRRDV